MKFVYTPPGAEPKTWPFNARTMRNDDVEAIEDVSGLAYNQWNEALDNGSAKAYRALLWVLLRRDIPDLKYGAVSFGMDEVNIELDDAESVELRDSLAKRAAAGTDLNEREVALLEQLRLDFPETPATVAAPPAPKAPESPAQLSDAATNGPSPTI